MYTAALDIGGTKTIAAIIDDSGSIHSKEIFPTLTRNSTEHLGLCSDALTKQMQRLSLGIRDIRGLGITLPGIVDPENGVLLYAPYAKWKEVKVADLMRSSLGIQKIRCENDVNACAIGEMKLGLGKQYRDFVWMTVSTGVGGAIVSDGKLIRGAQGFAGELGHLKVEYEHPSLCTCGQYGCLEAEASGTALNRIIQEKTESDPAFKRRFAESGLKIDGAGCAELAKNGDEMAQAIFCKIGRYLGRGISYCINILNTQAVIVGGGVSASLELMLPGIEQSVEENVFSKMQHTVICRTALGYEAALFGAASLIL